MPDNADSDSRFPLIPEDLQNVDWKSALSDLTANDEFVIRDQVRALLAEAEAAANEHAIRLWNALAGLMSMSLKNDDSETPFHPTFVSAEGRTPALEDFPNETIVLLGTLQAAARSQIIAARVSDAMWIKEKDAVHGRAAVVAYLNSAELDLSTDRIMWAVPKILRAAHVSAELGKRATLYQGTMDKIEGWFPGDVSTPQMSYLAGVLLRLIFDMKWGSDQLKWADIAKRCADVEDQGLRLDVARQFLQIEIRFCERANATSRVSVVRERIATSFEDQAGTGTHMQKAHWLTQSIAMWRQVGGNGEKVQELMLRLKEEHLAAKEEMSQIETTFDATEIHEAALKAISGKSGIDAVIALACALAPVTREGMIAEIRSDFDEFPMTSILAASFHTVEGNVAAVIPTLDLGSDITSADNAEWLNGQFALKYSQRQTLVGQSYIESARREFLRSSQVSRAAWEELVNDNDFVPTGREEFFVIGLKAGVEGDFATCAHFLIPQLENSIRHVVAIAGGTVTVPTAENPSVQREIDLNQLLKDPKYVPNTIKVLGDETVLDLRALLVEGAGHNLRNRLSHGLIDHDSLYSPTVSYLWWVTLHLCARSYLAKHPDKIPAELPPDEPTSQKTSSP